jgi:3D (Asp-Asp-Asp) domain-containing protein
VRRQFAGSGARLAAFCTGLALIGAVPVALGADATDLRSRADRLRDVASSFETKRQSALLNLYGLESELESARAALASLDARRTTLAREHASTRRRLSVAERAAAVSYRRLEELLRNLYADGGTDPLAILLGSKSLDEALTGLESLDRAAAENRRILDQARATRAHLVRVDARLTARKAELDRLARATRTRAQELEAAAAARAAYVATLRRRQDLTTRQVSSLEAQARAAQQQAAELPTTDTASTSVAAPPATPLETAAATDGARTLTVSAIGYSLRGRTASGLPVGHGIVAVDPSVIPFGTRMYVPGYGEAVAADSGSAIRGNVIDLWFPSTAAAYAWGRRTVLITLR